MTMQARIDAERGEELALARVVGEVDAANADWAAARLRGLLTNHSHTLVVDLSATTYLDSAGIAMLFALAEAMRLHQQELRVVVAPGSPIARMVDLTGLDRTTPVHATADEALSRARAHPASPPA
jgi:anti-sigma B factor antagonist